MSYKTVILEKKDHIGTIVLNRPENLNTFNEDLSRDLISAIKEFGEDEDVRVIILKGAGRGFCAGIDITALQNKAPLDYYKWISLLGEINLTMSKITKPIIASVHNIAVANGVGLVASADLAIATESTNFGATAVNLGLFCMGPAVPMLRSLSRKKVLELILTGDLIDAEEAERIGLINKVVKDDELEEKTLELARKIAKKSPLAVQIGKKSFYELSDLEFEKALQVANNHFSLLCTTEDAQEGIDAFLNKREPEWKLK